MQNSPDAVDSQEMIEEQVIELLCKEPRAFPGRLYETRPWWPGMTLRDYFAAHATEQDIAPYINSSKLILRVEAKYRYADAMLKARQPKGSE